MANLAEVSSFANVWTLSFSNNCLVAARNLWFIQLRLANQLFEEQMKKLVSSLFLYPWRVTAFFDFDKLKF
jgi:hypothetical protein